MTAGQTFATQYKTVELNAAADTDKWVWVDGSSLFAPGDTNYPYAMACEKSQGKLYFPGGDFQILFIGPGGALADPPLVIPPSNPIDFTKTLLNTTTNQDACKPWYMGPAHTFSDSTKFVNGAYVRFVPNAGESGYVYQTMSVLFTNAVYGNTGYTVVDYVINVIPDTVPDVFSFAAQTNVPLSSSVTSNAITVTGITNTTAISISGGNYRINGGAWQNSAGTVSKNDTVEVQLATSAAYLTATSATLTIGGVATTFSATTVAAPGTIPTAFTFVDQSGVDLSTLTMSNAITVTGITAPSVISISGGEYQINSGVWVSSTGTISLNDRVRVKLTSAGSYSTAATATLTIGGVVGTFSVTTQADIAPAPVSTPTIAPLVVTIPNTATLPPIVNMTDGEGPSFMDDLLKILSTAVGQSLHYVGQNAQGTVILSGYNGGTLAFIPHTFQIPDTRANGIYALGDGRYQVVRGGQSLTIATAVVRLDQLTALFPGLRATLGDNGVITATVNGVTYAVQPGVAVQLDPATGNARLVMGADGYWHFIDTLGNHQILYPAFASPVMLRNALLGLDANATMSIQLDGTAAIVFKGQRYTLVPDITLSQVPTERLGQYWWQESALRFWVTNAQPLGTAQGFTVRP